MQSSSRYRCLAKKCGVILAGALALVASLCPPAGAAGLDGFFAFSSDGSSLSSSSPQPRRARGAAEDENSPAYYANSANWRWLETSGRIFPGARIINATAQTGCTIGWLTQARGITYALVAGHCGQPNDTFVTYSANGKAHRIGIMASSQFINGTTDWASIQLLPGADYAATLPRRGPLLYRASRRITARVLRPGMTRICSLGATSGLSCGPYLRTDRAGMIHYYAKVAPGDSGAPVFVLDKGKVTPLGIISTAWHPGDSEITAQPLEPLLASLGMRLL